MRALSPEPAARYAGRHQCLSELPVQQLDGHRRARRHRLQIAYYAARIITTAVVFAILLHWASDIGPRLAVKSPTELEILLILPLVYYIFDYATNVYTTLFHSGSVVTVEFLAFALCAF